MSALGAWISKLPNYRRAFGLFDGLRLLLQVEGDLPARSTRVRQYRVPGYPAPIALRDSRSDHAIFWQCLVMRHYDLARFPQSERVLDVYRARVARGERPLVIDCGGNIGLAAVWFATCFPAARVVTVEPDADNLAMIRRNVAAFADRVTVRAGGIWNERGWLRILNPEAGAAAFRVERVDEAAPGALRAYTVEELCEEAGDPEPLIVKLDIEGAQARVFSGATEWVARAHLIILELDDWLLPWRGTSRSFFQSMSRHPFEYLIGGESLFCYRDVHADRAPA